jgi:GNAT superfamily N-acetyltransferase
MSLASRMRRYLGINVVRVLQRELGCAALGYAAQRHCARNIECRVLSEREALQFANDPQLELTPAWVRNAYAGGGVCIGAIEGRRLLGYTWLAFAVTRYASGVSIGFDGRFRYSYKSFVRPECRGQRIAQALHALADRRDLRRGRTHALNFLEFDNHASFAALERAGSRTLGYAAYAKCFGMVVAVRSPAVKRAGIHLYGPRFYEYLWAWIAARIRAWPTPTIG